MANAKCWHYDAIDLKDKANCINCSHWDGSRCRDEALLRKQYEESQAFKAYDRMMRSNRGVGCAE